MTLFCLASAFLVHKYTKITAILATLQLSVCQTNAAVIFSHTKPTIPTKVEINSYWNSASLKPSGYNCHPVLGLQNLQMIPGNQTLSKINIHPIHGSWRKPLPSSHPTSQQFWTRRLMRDIFLGHGGTLLLRRFWRKLDWTSLLHEAIIRFQIYSFRKSSKGLSTINLSANSTSLTCFQMLSRHTDDVTQWKQQYWKYFQISLMRTPMARLRYYHYLI